MSGTQKCELCGEPMPEGEEMFKYHGYSGNCPKEPLKKEYPQQEGTWTLTAPDGRQWQAASGLKAVAKERNERIPPEVQLARINAVFDEDSQQNERIHEWRPIDTAPRDGTPVDLWHISGVRMTEVWWDADDGCWSCALDDEDFSHWMSLPEPPERSTTHETCHAMYPESMK